AFEFWRSSSPRLRGRGEDSVSNLHSTWLTGWEYPIMPSVRRTVTIVQRHPMKWPQCVIGFAALLLLAPPSRADSVTLVASRDTTIYQGNPSNSNGAGQTMFAGTTGEAGSNRALIGFQIAGNIPAGSTISSVQLSLVLTKVSIDEFKAKQIELHRLLAAWGEGNLAASRSGVGEATPADGT